MRSLAVISLVLGLVAVGCEGKQEKPDESPEAQETESAEKEGGDDSGITEKMAEEHEGDQPDATGMVSGKPSQPVTTESVEYAEVDGTAVEGYLAKPEEASGDLPALIVIHEWWGLNDNIRKMTERLAGEGYTALAVDLYEGDVAETPKKARSRMKKAMNQKSRLKNNLEQAYEYLDTKVGAPRIGVIGWCFGGGWSLQTALMFPEKLDATVIYYGELVTEKSKLEPLSMPIVGFFGSEDEAISPDKVETFEQRLTELDKEASIHVYEGADHAFANPSGERYDPEAAKDAWKKTLQFLETHLKSDD